MYNTWIDNHSTYNGVQTEGVLHLNTLRPRQNTPRFAEIFKCILLHDAYVFWFKFQQTVFLSVELAMSQLWSR